MTTMSDNEIIKAVERCSSGDCTGCTTGFYGCLPADMYLIRDLINRQKAEIERLRADLVRACAERDARICTAAFFRAEAIKEFAEEAENKLLQLRKTYRHGKEKCVVDACRLELKEMVGDGHDR